MDQQQYQAVPPYQQQPQQQQQQQQYQGTSEKPHATATTSAGVPLKHGHEHVFKTPFWISIIRGLQMIISLLVLIMAAFIIHGLALDAVVFALVCGLFTWVVVLYATLTEKVRGCHGGYNIWAILSLDLLMCIFWLSSMGANAALRASFTVSVNADCYSDGSTINSGYCNVWKRGLEKRGAVATDLGLAMISAIAGLSALELLLFLASLIYLGHKTRMHWQAHRPAKADGGNVEMNVPAQQPVPGQHQPQHQQPQPQYQQPQPQPQAQTDYAHQQPNATGQPYGIQGQQPTSPHYTSQQSVSSMHTGHQPQELMQPQYTGQYGYGQQQSPYAPSGSPAPQGQYQYPPQGHGGSVSPPPQQLPGYQLPAQ